MEKGALGREARGVQLDDSQRVAAGMSGGSGHGTVPLPRMQSRRQAGGHRAGALEVGQASRLQQGGECGRGQVVQRARRGTRDR